MNFDGQAERLDVSSQREICWTRLENHPRHRLYRRRFLLAMEVEVFELECLKPTPLLFSPQGPRRKIPMAGTDNCHGIVFEPKLLVTKGHSLRKPRMCINSSRHVAL